MLDLRQLLLAYRDLCLDPTVVVVTRRRRDPVSVVAVESIIAVGMRQRILYDLVLALL